MISDVVRIIEPASIPRRCVSALSMVRSVADPGVQSRREAPPTLHAARCREQVRTARSVSVYARGSSTVISIVNHVCCADRHTSLRCETQPDAGAPNRSESAVRVAHASFCSGGGTTKGGVVVPGGQALVVPRGAHASSRSCVERVAATPRAPSRQQAWLLAERADVFATLA